MPKGYMPLGWGEACFNAVHGKYLRDLDNDFDIVWCTWWEEDANAVVSPHLGLPQFPVISMSQPGWTEEPWFGKNTYKLPLVRDFVGDRPFAWMDDDLGEDAHAYARARTYEEGIPSLLVQTKCSVGFGLEEYKTLKGFAYSLRNRNEPEVGVSIPPREDL